MIQALFTALDCQIDGLHLINANKLYASLRFSAFGDYMRIS